MIRWSLFVLCLLIAGSSIAQGIDFFEGTWEEAMAEAKKQDKIIFVDAFAEWCGPCKRMAKYVFTDDKVGAFYNKNFVNLKLDMEKGEGITFRKKYPVSAFPTLFFIDYTGEVVQQVRGAQQVEGFIKLGEQALGKIDRSGEYAEAYEAGDRDPELVFNYVRALNKAGKPSLAIANEYLRDQDDLTSDFNLRFILEAVTEADSRIFGLMAEHKDQIIQLTSEAEVKEKVRLACEATAQKGVEFKMESLIEEAVDKMEDHYPERATAFRLNTEMEFYQVMKDEKKFLKTAKKYGAKIVADDPAELALLAQNIAEVLPGSKKAVKLAEKFAARAAKAKQSYKHLLTYADILAQQGKIESAETVLQEARKLAEADGPMAVRHVDYYLKQIKG